MVLQWMSFGLAIEQLGAMATAYKKLKNDAIKKTQKDLAERHETC